ncbi:MAG TPA: hypothetical protein VMN04_04040 [Thermoanaerobaculia bacterium]|nr:hypothetical protein [Thermoanaerobaculia bacterium]
MPLYEFTCTARGTTFEEHVAAALETRGVPHGVRLAFKRGRLLGR